MIKKILYILVSRIIKGHILYKKYIFVDVRYNVRYNNVKEMIL